ncbi:MAG: aminotransferase class IV [Acidobacteriota bacterium]
MIHYVDGKFVDESEAKIPVNDLGVIRGYGIFDFLRTYNKKPFYLKEHLERLINSANIVGLDISWNLDELKKIVEETLLRNGNPEAYIRILVTGGKTEDSITPAGEPTLAVLIEQPHYFPEGCYTEGIKVITISAERHFPRSKYLNYTLGVVAMKKAKEENANEVLYLNRNGFILEGITSNFFVFKGDILITPEENVLIGITRNIVLELAKDKFKIEKRNILLSELEEADEAFITSTTREVMPVVQVDNIIIKDGNPGKNTKKLIELFRKITENY